MDTIEVKQAIEVKKTEERRIPIPFYFKNKSGGITTFNRVGRDSNGKLISTKIHTMGDEWVNISSPNNIVKLPENIEDITKDEFHTMLDKAIQAIENTLFLMETQG